MSGYDDPTFRRTGAPEPDPADADHCYVDPLPRDPSPAEGTIRVLTGGTWMTWEHWQYVRTAGSYAPPPPEIKPPQLTKTGPQQGLLFDS